MFEIPTNVRTIIEASSLPQDMKDEFLCEAKKRAVKRSFKRTAKQTALYSSTAVAAFLTGVGIRAIIDADITSK